MARLPKVELHCHVSGSVRPTTMRAFVEADGLAPRLWQTYSRAAPGEGLTAYLARFAAWDAVVRTPERIRQMEYAASRLELDELRRVVEQAVGATFLPAAEREHLARRVGAGW